MSKLNFNEKGLIPAIIQDADTGEVLMLGYMNEESLRRTLEPPARPGFTVGVERSCGTRERPPATLSRSLKYGRTAKITLSW